jgi:hypothetical protein
MSQLMMVDPIQRGRISRYDPAIPARSAALDFSFTIPQPSAPPPIDGSDPEDVCAQLTLELTPENIALAGLSSSSSSSSSRVSNKRRTWRHEQQRAAASIKVETTAAPTTETFASSFAPSFAASFAPSFATSFAPSTTAASGFDAFGTGSNASDNASSSTSVCGICVHTHVVNDIVCTFRADQLEKADSFASVGVDVTSTGQSSPQSVSFGVVLHNDSHTLSKLSINKKYVTAASVGPTPFEYTRETLPTSLTVPITTPISAPAFATTTEAAHQLLKFHCTTPKTDTVRARSKIAFQGNTKALISVSIALNPALCAYQQEGEPAVVLSDVSVQASLLSLLNKDSSYEHVNVKIRPQGTYNAQTKVVHFTSANGEGLTHKADKDKCVHQFDAIIDVTGSVGVLDTSITAVPVIVKGVYTHNNMAMFLDNSHSMAATTGSTHQLVSLNNEFEVVDASNKKSSVAVGGGSNGGVDVQTTCKTRIEFKFLR